MLSRCATSFWRARLPVFARARFSSTSASHEAVIPDANFMNIPPKEDPLLALFTGMLTQHGNRQRASRVVSRTLVHLHTLTGAPPLPIFREGIFAIAPLVKTKKMKTSALKHIIQPMVLTERRSLWFAFRWLLDECGHPGPLDLEERIAREIIGIHNGDSKLLAKKQTVHTEAALNKASIFHSPRSRIR